MMQWLQCAQQRPLHVPQVPLGVPRILIMHTMVGNLVGTETYFRNGGSGGTFSTFGVGGPHDGLLDGVIYQWQPLDMKAYAQWAGNDYASSVETADGGNPANPWSDKQLDALVELTVEWCRTTGNPCRLVTSTADHGIGYHEQFPAWNQSGHVCPGHVREQQLRSVVIPRAAALLNPEDDMTPEQAADLASVKADMDKLMGLLEHGPSGSWWIAKLQTVQTSAYRIGKKLGINVDTGRNITP